LNTLNRQLDILIKKIKQCGNQQSQFIENMKTVEENLDQAIASLRQAFVQGPTYGIKHIARMDESSKEHIADRVMRFIKLIEKEATIADERNVDIALNNKLHVLLTHNINYIDIFINAEIHWCSNNRDVLKLLETELIIKKRNVITNHIKRLLCEINADEKKHIGRVTIPFPKWESICIGGASFKKRAISAVNKSFIENVDFIGSIFNDSVLKAGLWQLFTLDHILSIRQDFILLNGNEEAKVFDWDDFITAFITKIIREAPIEAVIGALPFKFRGTSYKDIFTCEPFIEWSLKNMVHSGLLNLYVCMKPSLCKRIIMADVLGKADFNIEDDFDPEKNILAAAKILVVPLDIQAITNLLLKSAWAFPEAKTEHKFVVLLSDRGLPLTIKPMNIEDVKDLNGEHGTSIRKAAKNIKTVNDIIFTMDDADISTPLFNNVPLPAQCHAMRYLYTLSPNRVYCR
jgi:hypothetical protein